MSQKIELLPEVDNFLKTGKLFDALGFSGEGEEFEMIDFIDAAAEVIPNRFGSDEHRRYIKSSLAQESRELEAKGYNEDTAASYLLGSVMWRISVADGPSAIPQSEIEQLLSRSVMNIMQSREMYGRGDERLFHMAFANYTEQFGQDYPRHKRRALRQLTMYIEHSIYEARSMKPQLVERDKVSLWKHVLNGMAIIAMKDGYAIQPPPDQTDKDGAWQLPREQEDEEDDV